MKHLSDDEKYQKYINKWHLNNTNKLESDEEIYKEMHHLFNQSLDDILNSDFQNQELLYKGLSTLKFIVDRFGMYDSEKISSDVLKIVFDSGFGNHGSLKIHIAGLELIESFCVNCNWILNYIYSNNIQEECFKAIKDPLKSLLPVSNVSYIFNSIINIDENLFSHFMNEHLMDYLIKNINDETINNINAFWILISIQNIILSKFFIQYEYYNEIIKIALKYIESENITLVSISFSILAKIISYDGLTKGNIEKISEEYIIEIAYKILKDNLTEDMINIFDYLINYICVSDENTMNLVHHKFLDILALYFKQDDKPLYQSKIIELVSNMAISPPETIEPIFKSEISTKIIQLLKFGSIDLKKEAVTFLVNILLNPFSFELTLKFLKDNDLIVYLIDLLSCYDNNLITNLLNAFTFLISKAQTIEEKPWFMDYFLNTGFIEKLTDISLSEESNIVSGMASTLINVLCNSK